MHVLVVRHVCLDLHTDHLWLRKIAFRNIAVKMVPAPTSLVCFTPHQLIPTLVCEQVSRGCWESADTVVQYSAPFAAGAGHR